MRSVSGIVFPLRKDVPCPLPCPFILRKFPFIQHLVIITCMQRLHTCTCIVLNGTQSRRQGVRHHFLLDARCGLVVDGLHVPHHPPLRYEALAAERAVVTLVPKVLLERSHSMLAHFILFANCLCKNRFHLCRKSILKTEKNM